MTGPFHDRRRRARRLAAQRPHAAEILRFYVALLDRQDAIFVSKAGPSPPAGTTGAPRDIHALSLDEVLPSFDRFVAEVGSFATPVVRDLSDRVRAAGRDAQRDLLAAVLARGDLESMAAALDCSAPQAWFFPHAFLQPLAERGRPRGQPARATADGLTCPSCGWPPQVAYLADTNEARGRRMLVCSLCACEWPIRRGVCAGCGEHAPDRLTYHENDALPHVRVEECRSCRRYVKSVDQRKDGRAVPLADEIASVELDLWSEARGLAKIQRNVVGM